MPRIHFSKPALKCPFPFKNISLITFYNVHHQTYCLWGIGATFFRSDAFCLLRDIKKLVKNGDVHKAHTFQGLFLSFQVIRRNPAFPGDQAVLDLTIPPSIWVSLQHLQTSALSEPHGLFVSSVVGDGHIHVPAEVVVNDLAFLNRLGANRRDRDAVPLPARIKPTAHRTQSFRRPGLALHNHMRANRAERRIPTDS